MAYLIFGLAMIGVPLTVAVVLFRQPLARLIDRAEEVKFPGGYVKARMQQGASPELFSSTVPSLDERRTD